MNALKPKTVSPKNSIVGWREYVALPDLEIPLLRAKLDTGARTSALHAVKIRTEMRGDEDWVSFHIPVHGMPRTTRSHAKVIDRRRIKNTSGIPEVRIVIATMLALGRYKWRIELSLADRENMTHDLILGRTAIRRYKLLVASGSSFLAGPPDLTESTRNGQSSDDALGAQQGDIQ